MRLDDAALDRHRLAGEQPADDRDRLAHRDRGPIAADPERGVVRAAGTEAEHGSAAGQLVERRYGRRREHGVARVRVRHPRADPDPARGSSDRCQRDVDVAQQPVVVDPRERRSRDVQPRARPRRPARLGRRAASRRRRRARSPIALSEFQAKVAVAVDP